MGALAELFSGALPAFVPSRTADDQARRAKTATRDHHHRPGRPHVVSPALFRDALAKERKRAERFDQPFMLVLIAAKPDAAIETINWVPAIETLRSVTGETDLLGWFDKGTLGAIVPEIATDADVRRRLYKSTRRAIIEHLLSEGAFDRFSVRLHIHSGARAAASSSAESLPAELDEQTAKTPLREVLKRALDIAGSAALMLALLPVYAIVAALVKLTSNGPVFFRQDRVGRMGQPFRMLKFRSMKVNADSAIHQKYVSNFIANSQLDKSGVCKIVNDPRVTAIGHILRKTSLDELPQFWNVLRGEMSLVGPRPPLAYEVQQYKPWHYRRVLEAKPGITGLWQVSGRSRTTFDDMVRLDLRYAKNPSAWTDIKILVATPRAVISGKGAC